MRRDVRELRLPRDALTALGLATPTRRLCYLARKHSSALLGPLPSTDCPSIGNAFGESGVNDVFSS